LLANGSLEGPYYAQGGATRTVPNGWNLWVGLGAPESVPNSDKTQVRDGAIAWKLRQSGVAFAAAGYQQVSGLTAGDAVRAAAYGWVFTCNDAATSCAISDPPYRRSDATAGASLKVGIDPTGGIDPLATTVHWSAAVAPYDQWAEISVATVAQGETVTVFLYMMQATGMAINEVTWDNASLVLDTGADAASGDVPFVVPQGVRPDGSIVHVVQAGDTLWSITYAYVDYGVTVESIAALNNLKPNTRYLQLGQELIILPPGSVDPVTGQPVTPGGAVPPVASATPQAAGPENTLAPEITPSPEDETTVATLETVPLPGANTPEPTATLAVTSAPTLTPSPVPTTIPTLAPTVTPEAVAAGLEELTSARGDLCISVFQDADLNALRGPDEAPLEAAQVVIVSAVGTNTSDYVGAEDPLCFNVAPRQFQIEVRLPDGYGATTPDRVLVRTVAGRRVEVAFGAAAGYLPPQAPDVTPGALAAGGIDPGEVAPLVEVPVASTRSAKKSWVDRLYDHSAFLVLGAGGLVVLASLALVVLLRRPGE
jgi:LysM repeat protein